MRTSLVCKAILRLNKKLKDVKKLSSADEIHWTATSKGKDRTGIRVTPMLPESGWQKVACTATISTRSWGSPSKGAAGIEALASFGGEEEAAQDIDQKERT